MSTNRPDPGEFIEKAQQMLRELFGGAADDAAPWGTPTPPPGERSASRANREPSAREQRENLTFALATRAVEALEDLSLNVAAIRQRLERAEGQSSPARLQDDAPDPGGADLSKGNPGGTTA